MKIYPAQTIPKGSLSYVVKPPREAMGGDWIYLAIRHWNQFYDGPIPPAWTMIEDSIIQAMVHHGLTLFYKVYDGVPAAETFYLNSRSRSDMYLNIFIQKG